MEHQERVFAAAPAAGQLPAALPATLTAELAKERGLQLGPTVCVTCVSGSYALDAARGALASGRANAVAVLGLETLNRQIQGGFCALKALASGYTPGQPVPADGILLGEAACCVVLEPLAAALARGARVHGVLHANQVWVDATHLIAPDPSGAGLARAFDAALQAAGVEHADLDALTLTADTSPLYAATYAAALEPRFGATWSQRVESWEPHGGHALAASATLGLAWACSRPQAGWTANLTVGFGGQNAVTVVGPPPALAPAAPAGPAPGLVASAWATEGAPDLEDRFAPRWNPRRPLPALLRPALEAAWSALVSAGWAGEPGEPIAGGLVLAVDRWGFAAAERFAKQLDTASTLRPADFLASLPSTPASTLGLVLGLHAYQATLSHPTQAPFEALRHSCELLRSGTLARALVVALSVREAQSDARWGPGGEPRVLATALALQADAGELRIEAVTPRGAPRESGGTPLLADLSPSYRGLPAAGLLALAQATAPGCSWGGARVEVQRGGRA